MDFASMDTDAILMLPFGVSQIHVFYGDCISWLSSILPSSSSIPCPVVIASERQFLCYLSSPRGASQISSLLSSIAVLYVQLALGSDGNASFVLDRSVHSLIKCLFLFWSE